MADRVRHIKGRNLVVCKTFDDFAEAVANVDFTVEDVVGYVVSLSNCYYWLNIESIWGAIGFTWTGTPIPLTDEEAILYPNPLYRLEQVTAEGVNIPMDEQWLIEHKLSKGTGVFNRTTIPFTHIPHVPDGHRITAITGNTLANINIANGVLYIDKSNWINLKNIDNICIRNITLYADLDGSDIISANTILGNINAKLYLKADLSNIPANSLITNCGGSLEFGGSKIYRLFAANDYYKDLHIQIGTNVDNSVRLHPTAQYDNQYIKGHPVFQWEGIIEPFKFEKFFDIIDYNNVFCPTNTGVIYINCLNQKYHLKNFNNSDDDNNQGIYPILRNHYYSSEINNTAADITIDCTNGISNVRMDYDLGYRGFETHKVKMLPIKYIGNVTSIGAYNPCLKVENDEWPEFRQDLINKLNNNLGNYILHNIDIVNATHKCPYTIDCRNLSSVRVLTHMNLSILNYQNYDSDTGNDRAIDIYPSLIVDSTKIYSNFDLRTTNRNFLKIPEVNIQCVHVNAANSSLYFGRNTHITCTQIDAVNYSVYDASTPYIKLKKLREDVNLNCHMADNYELPIIKYYTLSSGYINLYEIDATDEELMAGIVNTGIGIDKGTNQYFEVRHPLILSNARCFAYEASQKNHYTNFRLVYRSYFINGFGLSCPKYTNAELIAFAESFVDTGNDEEYKIILSTELYNRMSNLTTHGMTLLQYITSLGYTPAFE